jgi:hypothetical protein
LKRLERIFKGLARRAAMGDDLRNAGHANFTGEKRLRVPLTLAQYHRPTGRGV